MILFYLLTVLLHLMKAYLKQILDQLPFDNWKSVIGIVGVALVLGLQQMGFLDDQTATMAITFFTAITGVGVTHRKLKEDLSL